MDDRSHGGPERDTEDADELLYADRDDNSTGFGLDSPPFKPDHCDLLLDAIDAQLGKLQVQSQKSQGSFREHGCSNAAPLRWSQSVSKDTGLGSTTQTNDTPMSCLDLMHTPVERTSDSSTGHQEAPVICEDPKQKLSVRRTRDKEEMESHREQVIWRLERMLGDTYKEGKTPGETHPLSDSICTEDFVRHFREEMVELPLLEGSRQQLDRKKVTERAEISDSGTFQDEQKGQRLPYVERSGTANTGKGEGFCDSSGIKTLHFSEKVGAGETYASPQSHAYEDSIRHRTEVATELLQINTSSPKARCLAGVPMLSFDTVSIDSDLDSICTEQVRQHIHRQPGWRSLIQSVRNLDELCSNQSDDETTTQEESEPQSTSVQRSCLGTVQKTSLPVHKAQHKRRESHRRLCYLSDDNKDTDEEMNHWNRRFRPEKTLERMQSNWTTLRERLSTLRQKCQKEEETLSLNRTQLNEVQLSLSELQQRRQHALQELEQLAAETAQMEREKKTLESILRESRSEKDSISRELQKLQRQRQSRLQEGGGTEVELKTQHRANVIVSVLEREEMERQLDCAKSELFAEQRHAREKLESMQEKLEETREELQKAKETESSLRNRCVCLEENQKHTKQQSEAVEYHVIELQGDLRECETRVGTLEKMLAQKELQLLHIQEQQSTLQADRDGLKGELQQLKTQHYSTLKEAQEQAKKVTETVLKQQRRDLALAHETQIQKITKQAEEEKANALKEQALSLTKHIESLQNSIQLREEEANRLRICLEKEKEEAKNREEEMCIEVLEKVHKAVEEEKRKREAEKVEAVQMHCGILEEQHRQSLENTRSKMHQEKSKALALQHKVVQLQTRVQELEAESCARQKEQESLVAVICKTLKEEHQAELQKTQRHMAQESQRTVLQLEKAVQLAEKETDRLRVTLEEKERSHSEATADMDQQLRHWAMDLEKECWHLHLLVEQKGNKPTAQLLYSSTVAEALTILRTTREQLKHFISHLHQELDSQRQTTEQLSKDKERELSIQRQQLRMERNQALDSLKERLIQEHVEELSSLNWAHIRDGGSERVAVSLRKQLKAKDLELRQVQRSMSQWKEQTAARLACKFEEELTSDLERKTPKAQDEKQKNPERPEEMTHGSKEAQISVCVPCLHAVDSAASDGPSDTASLKLLRYLQSRVKQLRVENQTLTWSPSPPNTDLTGSFLKTIEDSAGIQSVSSG